MYDDIDKTLGEVWKSTRLPWQLSAFTKELAAELNYELPHDDKVREPDDRSMPRADGEHAPFDVDALSDEQVDAMLAEMLAKKEKQE